MKTRNSNNSKSMNNDENNLNDLESTEILNKRGLPKRKTTLKINYKLFDSSEASDGLNYELNHEFNNKLNDEFNNKLNDEFNNKLNDGLNYELNHEYSDYLYNKYMKKDISFNLLNETEKSYFSKLNFQKQQELLDIKDIICKENYKNKPLLFQILELKVSNDIKSLLYKKYKDLDLLDKSSNEYYKLKSYIDSILTIPFGIYKNINVSNFNDYLQKSKVNLDNVIYGQENVKIHILEILSQYFSNSKSQGNIFGIYGPMGVGKTTIIKDGLSKVMDKPFNFISLGGAQDSCFLEGHSYTYEGSTYGKIIECLIKSKCMNPIIYFDELDKISNTPKGDEIINLLIHITDDSQNSNFQDKYFTGINIDLSKCIFVFSFNDESKINNILKDRIQLINVNGFSKEDKLKICKKFLIPKILNDFNLNNIKIKSEAIMFLIDNYSKEEGIRNLKHKIKKIVSKINLLQYSDFDLHEEKINIKFPLNVNLNLIKKLCNN